MVGMVRPGGWSFLPIFPVLCKLPFTRSASVSAFVKRPNSNNGSYYCSQIVSTPNMINIRGHNTCAPSDMMPKTEQVLHDELLFPQAVVWCVCEEVPVMGTQRIVTNSTWARGAGEYAVVGLQEPKSQLSDCQGGGGGGAVKSCVCACTCMFTANF